MKPCVTVNKIRLRFFPCCLASVSQWSKIVEVSIFVGGKVDWKSNNDRSMDYRKEKLCANCKEVPGSLMSYPEEQTTTTLFDTHMKRTVAVAAVEVFVTWTEVLCFCCYTHAISHNIQSFLDIIFAPNLHHNYYIGGFL